MDYTDIRLQRYYQTLKGQIVELQRELNALKNRITNLEKPDKITKIKIR